jgi:nitroreductase
MENDSLKFITERSSCRDFTGQPLQHGDLERLMEAARWAPSAGNRQPWHCFAVLNTHLKAALARAAYNQTFVGDAAVVFAVCADPEESAQRYGERGRSLYVYQDTANFGENLMLSATALGYGSCWVGAFDEKEVSRVLNLPKNLRPVALILVGPSRPNPQRSPRKPLSKTFTVIAEED